MGEAMFRIPIHQVLAFLFVFSVSTVSARTFQGVTMPERVKVSGKSLALNGIGMLEATIFEIDIYVAALYLEKPSRKAETVINGKNTWCVITQFVRDIGGGQLADGWRERLEDRAGKNLPKFKKRIDYFVSLLPNVREGDRHAFIYEPGKGLIFKVNGKAKGRIKGADFCPLIAKAFVGPDVDQDLKRALLKGSSH